MNQLIYKAISFAATKHQGCPKDPKNAFRKSADGRVVPYITHPIDVASRLDRAGAPIEIVCVGALHDTIEDTETTFEEIEYEFSREIAERVADYTLPDGVNSDFNLKRQYQLNKMSVADVWGVAGKMADKSSNLESLVSEPPAWGKNAMRGYATDASRIIEYGYRRFPNEKAIEILYGEAVQIQQRLHQAYPWMK